MRKKLTQKEVKTLDSMMERLCKIYHKIEDNDVELNYGNGTVASQISCAIASLETILQEY